MFQLRSLVNVDFYYRKTCTKDVVVLLILKFLFHQCKSTLTIRLQMLSLVGTADGGITPPLMAVQEVILDDEGSKVIGTLAYGTELAFNMLLLCAIYRV